MGDRSSAASLFNACGRSRDHSVIQRGESDGSGPIGDHGECYGSRAAILFSVESGDGGNDSGAEFRIGAVELLCYRG